MPRPARPDSDTSGCWLGAADGHGGPAGGPGSDGSQARNQTRRSALPQSRWLAGPSHGCEVRDSASTWPSGPSDQPETVTQITIDSESDDPTTRQAAVWPGQIGVPKSDRAWNFFSASTNHADCPSAPGGLWDWTSPSDCNSTREVWIYELLF